MKMRNKGLLMWAMLFLIPLMGNGREYEIVDYLNPTNPDRIAYIKKYHRIAMSEMERAGIPASIKLAQGILESGDGKSRLAKYANNHFGMKCGGSWYGDTFYLEDDDHDKEGNLIKSCFRVYERPEDSYIAHSEFLHDPKKAYRYGFLFDLDVMNYKDWAHGLKKSGYATNPRYAQLLIGIIEANDLHEFDKGKVPKKYKDDSKPIEPVEPGEIEPCQVPPARPIVKNEVVEFNGIRMVFASEGQSLESISNFTGVSVSKLRKYNDLPEGKIKFEEGAKVYLRTKKRWWRSGSRWHCVNEGETMHGISQTYGISLRKLYKRNRMKPGTEPAEGQRVALRRKVSRRYKIKLREKGEEPLPSIAEGGEEVPVILEDFKASASKEDLRAFVAAYIEVTDKPAPTVPSHTGGHEPVVTHPPAPEEPAPVVVEPDPAPPVIVTPDPDPNPAPPTVTQPHTPDPTPPTPAPEPETEAVYHTVKTGDTLYNISKRFGISVNELKRLNGLTDNIIKIGDKLRVK